MGAAMDEHALGAREPGALPACSAAAAAAVRRAGLEAAAVDFAEVSAQSVVGELMVLEALGLAAPGDGATLVGATGGPAVNPSGGALPADPVIATGLVRLREAALQLAGRAGAVQLEGPRSALVHATGGLAMQNHCVAVIEV
jgi:acetyl-CoA C-acetyltransferase